jgi:hypothetical protein
VGMRGEARDLDVEAEPADSGRPEPGRYGIIGKGDTVGCRVRGLVLLPFSSERLDDGPQERPYLLHALLELPIPARAGLMGHCHRDRRRGGCGRDGGVMTRRSGVRSGDSRRQGRGSDLAR